MNGLSGHYCPLFLPCIMLTYRTTCDIIKDGGDTMKRLLSFLLIISILFSFSFTSIAEEQISPNNRFMTIEYPWYGTYDDQYLYGANPDNGVVSHGNMRQFQEMKKIKEKMPEWNKLQKKVNAILYRYLEAQSWDRDHYVDAAKNQQLLLVQVNSYKLFDSLGVMMSVNSLDLWESSDGVQIWKEKLDKFRSNEKENFIMAVMAEYEMNVSDIMAYPMVTYHLESKLREKTLTRLLKSSWKQSLYYNFLLNKLVNDMTFPQDEKDEGTAFAASSTTKDDMFTAIMTSPDELYASMLATETRDGERAGVKIKVVPTPTKVPSPMEVSVPIPTGITTGYDALEGTFYANIVGLGCSQKTVEETIAEWHKDYKLYFKGHTQNTKPNNYIVSFDVYYYGNSLLYIRYKNDELISARFLEFKEKLTGEPCTLPNTDFLVNNTMDK